MSTDSSVLHLDFETRSAADLKLCGAEVYATHPSTDIMCMAFAFGDEPVEVWWPGIDSSKIARLLDHVRHLGTVIAHNAPFELAIWNAVGIRKYGWPSLLFDQTYCTMAMCYAMALPGSLDKAAAAVGLDKQKDLTGGRVMLKHSQPKEILEDGTIIWHDDLEELQKIYSYCAQDVEVERELTRRIMSLSADERDVWLMDYRINRRGVAVDLKAIEAAILIAEMETKRYNAELREITENSVATYNATGQFVSWLRSKGIDAEGIAKSDVTELLSDGALPKDVRRALEIRKEAAKSSVKKLAAMKNRTSEADGRMRGIFQYHGASTGRWAGRGPQPQNYPRPSLSQEQIDHTFSLLTRHET